MQLTDIAGNAALKEQLAPRLSNGQLSHAYILSGPAGSGRHTLARILAGAMVCSGEGAKPCGACPACRKAQAGIHPDIVTVCPEEEGKTVTVDQVRQMRADAWVRPNEAPRKVYMIEQADQLNSSAQNAMLKLLEEGPVYAAFLLLSENAGALLPTVRSRCEELALSPVSVPQAEQWLTRRFPEADPGRRRQAALDGQGLLGRAAAILSGEAVDDPELDEQAGQLVQFWLEGDEHRLMELCARMEKWDKQQFSALLDRMSVQLAGLLSCEPQRHRVLKMFGLMSTLRKGLSVNVNPGHLAGWLCAAACQQ